MFTEEVIMFHKQYYRLDEAVQKLGVDVITLLYALDQLNNKDMHVDLFAILSESKAIEKGYIYGFGCANGIALEILRDEIKTIILSLETKQETVDVRIKYVVVTDKFGKVIKWTATITTIYLHDIFITHSELTRLIALKAEHDGKPTAEQLQQQLDEAKARIAELEAIQAQAMPHNQPIATQHPYPCLKPITDIVEAFKHNSDFVKYGQGIKQQIIEDWLVSEHSQTRDRARHIKALITEHYNITTTR
jgi:hypothetical protein